MAKGSGLIGNISGKLGNAVGYALKDSNNKQTQAFRVYQPVVRNPKTYAQAEQRAIMAPIAATYRALKPIITRGFEGVPYGNKSRLEFLRQAMKNYTGPYFKKGAPIDAMPAVIISRGTLPSINIYVSGDDKLTVLKVSNDTTAPTTIGQLTALFKAKYPYLKDDDQLTFVVCGSDGTSIIAVAQSYFLKDGDNTAITGFSVDGDNLDFSVPVLPSGVVYAGTVIVSRQGDNGEHLRSTQALWLSNYWREDEYFSDAAKEAAIRSYMSAGTNSDWPTESNFE